MIRILDLSTGKFRVTLTRCKSCSQSCSGGGCGDGAGSGGGCCASKKSNGATGPTREDVERELCYSCRLTVSTMKKSVPEFLLVESGKRARRRAAKEEIQDFLL